MKREQWSGLGSAMGMWEACHTRDGVGVRATREAGGTEEGHQGLLHLRFEHLGR